jgi:hypothetical protein
MPEETREGYCKCGCGLLTRIPKYGDVSKGWVKGKPLDWLSGHYSRTKVKYVVDPVTGCWNWVSTLSTEGYGRVLLDGRFYQAHVITYQTKYGPVPEGKELDHLCRNRKCCNPDHVEPVTRTENVRRGARTKLTVESVRKIKQLCAEGNGIRQTAKEFGVAYSTVRSLLLGRSWKGV